MSSLDKDIRSWLESTIDNSIELPEKSEDTFKELLKDLDIHPTVENILVFQCGAFYGQALRMSIQKNRQLRIGDERGAIAVLKRRKEEIRNAYMKRRLNLR